MSCLFNSQTIIGCRTHSGNSMGVTSNFIILCAIDLVGDIWKLPRNQRFVLSNFSQDSQVNVTLNLRRSRCFWFPSQLKARRLLAKFSRSIGREGQLSFSPSGTAKSGLLNLANNRSESFAGERLLLPTFLSCWRKVWSGGRDAVRKTAMDCGKRSACFVASAYPISTPAYPILVLPYQIARQDVWTRWLPRGIAVNTAHAYTCSSNCFPS